MDLIREHLIYKNVPTDIQIDALKTQEQYEVIRLLLACRKEDVCVLVSDKSNKYILELLKELNISTRETAAAAVP